MTSYYTVNPKFYISVDCIIFGFNQRGLSLLLLKRKMDPERGKWSLMGGFVQENESVNDAAKRVLRELTGLSDVFMEQVGAFGEIHRDTGERVVSVAYYAFINIDEYDKESVKRHNAYWTEIHNVPELIFDHEQMVKQALEQMRRKAAIAPIGFNLLPKQFTLTQLQNLYEAIFGQALDKRNFRKKVAEMGFIEPTDMIDKTCSKRGARLYQFNQNVFDKDPKFKLYKIC